MEVLPMLPMAQAESSLAAALAASEL